MKESYWGVFVLLFGIISILLVYFFQTLTNINEHNYTLLKETTEAAMIDALDLTAYRNTGEVRIDQEKFVENFIRRFANNAQLSKNYKIEIYDVNEKPPKVSIKISSTADTNLTGKIMTFSIQNKLDAILEEPHTKPYETGTKPQEIEWPDNSLVILGDETSTDILDDSDDSYLYSQQCELTASTEGIAYVGRSYEAGSVNSKNCGALTCDTSDHNVALCSITTGNKISITGKSAGNVTVKIKGSSATYGNRTYRGAVIETPFVVRIMKESTVSFNPSSQVVRENKYIDVPVYKENCGNLVCNLNCTVIQGQNSVRIFPKVGPQTTKVTCQGYYDPATYTQYAAKSAEFTLTYYKQDKSKIDAADVETIVAGKYEVTPSVSHCGKLTCSTNSSARCSVKDNKTLVITPRNTGVTTVTAKCSGETDNYVEYGESETTFTYAYRTVENSSVSAKVNNKVLDVTSATATTVPVDLSHCGTLSCTADNGASCTISSQSGLTASLSVKPSNYGASTVTLSCSGEKTDFVSYNGSGDTFTLRYFQKLDSNVSFAASGSEINTSQPFKVGVSTENCNVSNCTGTNAFCAANNTVATIRPKTLGDGTVTINCTGIKDTTNYKIYNNSEAKYNLAYYGTGVAELSLNRTTGILTEYGNFGVTATVKNCGTLSCDKCTSISKNQDGTYSLIATPDSATSYGSKTVTVTCPGTIANNIRYTETSRNFTFTYYKFENSSISLQQSGSVVSEKTVYKKDDIVLDAVLTNCEKPECTGNSIAGCRVRGNKVTITPKSNGTTTLTVTCKGSSDEKNYIRYGDSSAKFTLKFLKSGKATISFDPLNKVVNNGNNFTITASTSHCGTFTCNGCVSSSGPNSDGQYTLTLKPSTTGSNSISATCTGETNSDSYYEDTTGSYTYTYTPILCPDNITPTTYNGKKICIRDATPYIDSCAYKTNCEKKCYGQMRETVLNQSAIDSCKSSCSSTYSSCTQSCDSTSNTCVNNVTDCDNLQICHMDNANAKQKCDECKKSANLATGLCYGSKAICYGTCDSSKALCESNCPAPQTYTYCDGSEFEDCTNGTCQSGTKYKCDDGWSHYDGSYGYYGMRCYKLATTS